MRNPWVLALIWAILVCLTFGGCQKRQGEEAGDENKTPEVESRKGWPKISAHQITGPFAHQNLAVFLIHSDTQDQRDFLTLNEGLAKGLVKVAEKENEQVGELMLDNQSDRPLYLQEGERVQGGKQDRTIIASLVVAPKSGPRAVPTMCVEQSRWEEGKAGRQFGRVYNLALAPKAVRGSSKIERDQEKVWASVATQKMTANAVLNSSNSNSSINETLDSPEATKVSEEYAKALLSAVAKHGDAVGVVVVVNGQFEEANIYPNQAVFAKLFPALIRSYAIQAVMLKDQAKVPTPTTASMVKVLAGSKEKTSNTKNIDPKNISTIREMDGNLFDCLTRYEGQVIHWQLMAKTGARSDKAVNQARARALGSNW
jgi:hypothetical protein